MEAESTVGAGVDTKAVQMVNQEVVAEAVILSEISLVAVAVEVVGVC